MTIEKASERPEESLRGELARKQQFIMMVAHDMKNFLAPLAYAVELLDHEDCAVSPQRRSMIRQQVLQLSRLVDDLLDIVCSEQGRMSLRIDALDLREVITASVEVALPALAAQDHHLTLVPAPPIAAVIHGDGSRLTQALSNLLINAAKFTPKGGEIFVMLKHETPCFTVSVRDTGIGIAADMLPKIFDIYERAVQGPDYQRGGLGLGLAVARHLVELHGGTLSAHSAGLGQGSEFLMTLPRSVF